MSQDDHPDGDLRGESSMADAESDSDDRDSAEKYTDGQESDPVDDRHSAMGDEQPPRGSHRAAKGSRDESSDETEKESPVNDDNVFGPLAESGPIEAESPKLENVVFVMVGIAIGLWAIFRLVGIV